MKLFEAGPFAVETDHVEPFQCSSRICSSPVPLSYQPAAHTSLEETAATLNSRLSLAPWLGLEATLHAEPFQCSIRVRFGCPLALLHPTAHASLEATAATP